MRTHYRRWPILLLLTLLCLGFLGLSWAAAAPAAAPSPDEACQELLQNGGFESGSGWTINPGAYPAGYVPQPTHSGQQAMRLGIVESFNRWAYSSVQQKVILPPTAQRITLRFHVYPLSEASAGDDEQIMVLLNPSSRATIAVPWRALSNGQAWSEQVVDLSAYRGQTLLVYFNVYNDGRGGRTAMYLDDVSLQACSAATATPTPKPTEAPTSTPWASVTATPIPWPTPTPPPGPCRPQCLPNGDFESYGYWTLGKTPLYPAYVSGKGVGGSRAMQLGNVGQNNVLSYSSVRQDVYVPPEANSVGIRFWYWPLSEGTDGRDHQELLLLQPQSQQVIAILWRETRDDRQWQQGWADLTPYRGQTVSVYFNAYNDGTGGRTAMYLDDVCLELCGPVPPTCVPKTSPPCCPTPTPTSCGLQPCPTCCHPPCDHPWCTGTATPTPTSEITPTATPTPPCGGAWPGRPPRRWWPWPITLPPRWGHPLFWLILATVLALLFLLLAVLLLRRIWRLLQTLAEPARRAPPEPAPLPVEAAQREKELEITANLEKRLEEVRDAAKAVVLAAANVERQQGEASTAAAAIKNVEMIAQGQLDQIRMATADISTAAAVMRSLMTGGPAAPQGPEVTRPPEAAPQPPTEEAPVTPAPKAARPSEPETPAAPEPPTVEAAAAPEEKAAPAAEEVATPQPPEEEAPPAAEEPAAPQPPEEEAAPAVEEPAAPQPPEEEAAPAAEEPAAPQPPEEKAAPAAEEPAAPQPPEEEAAPAAEEPATPQPPEEEVPAAEEPPAPQPPEEKAAPVAAELATPQPPEEGAAPAAEEVATPQPPEEGAAPAAEEPAAPQPPEEEAAPAVEEPATPQPPEEEVPAAEEPPAPQLPEEKAAPADEEPAAPQPPEEKAAPAAEEPAAPQPPEEEAAPAAEEPPAPQPPEEETPAPPPSETERPPKTTPFPQATEYEGLELSTGALDLLERLTVLRPSLQTSEMKHGIVHQLKEAQELREESLLSAHAVARAVLEDENIAFVGRTYVLQAGVAGHEVEGLAGEPFDLPFRNAFEPLVFDIVVHGGANIEFPEWQKRLRYEPLNPEPQLVEFAFRPTAVGHCSPGVDFYHEQRWLGTIRLEFDAVEAPSSEPSV